MALKSAAHPSQSGGTLQTRIDDRIDGRMHDDTRLMHAGRDSAAWHGFVNPPVYHASTVLSPTVSDLLNRTQPYIYGRRGTPTTDALERAVTSLEGGAGAVLCPSGLSACTLALLSCLKPGDHLLMTASVYGPVRHACEGVLARLGVETTWYDGSTPVAAAFRANTRALYVEVPGSYTLDMHDIPALVRLAQAHDALVIADNSWATPLFFQPHAFGIDLSIQAGTKYLVGHSDAMLGTVSASERAWPALKQLHGDLGLCAGPDDVYLALRGLRTLGVRLRQHQRNALTVATWLAARPKCSACCIRRCPATTDMRCGAVIFVVHRGCSRSCCSRHRGTRSMHFSITSRCSGSAIRGAATRASRCRSSWTRTASPHVGRPTAAACACISAWRIPAT